MERQPTPSRRGFMWGAAAAGAAAAAVVALPRTPEQQDAAVSRPDAEPAPERGGGYRLSDHVKQYYKTTLV